MNIAPKLEVKEVPAYRGDYSSAPAYTARRMTWTGEFNGASYTVEAIERRRPYWVGPGKKASTYFRSHISEHWRSYVKKPVVYMDVEDESVLANFVNRESRPVALYGKTVRALFAHLGLVGKLGWNKYAGCAMCPCSPGFIWGGAPELDFGNDCTTRRYDVHVLVKGLPEIELSAKALANQRRRANGIGSDPTIDTRQLAAMRL